MFKKWLNRMLLIIVVVVIILTSCAYVTYAAYWYGSHEVVVAEKSVAQATEAPIRSEPTAEPKVVVTTTTASGNLPLVDEVFQTLVECQDPFNDESSWLICEPGVLLDDTAAWTIPSTKEVWYVNVPEGGFTYFSMGEGVITIDKISLKLPGEKGLNYLVLIRGRIDDGIADSDLNLTAQVIDFIPGHAIWSIMPPGAYVSKDWFRQQLVVSTTTGGTNCGATGCSRVRVVLFDVDSHLYQMFEILHGNIDAWEQVEKN